MAVTRYIENDQHSFTDIQVFVDNIYQGTLQSISYGTTQDKGYTYGSGQQSPRSIQRGLKSHQGSFSILHNELVQLVDNDILDGYFDIVVTYEIETTGASAFKNSVTDRIKNAQVMGFDKSLSIGDFSSSHTLDFMALEIDYGKRKK